MGYGIKLRVWGEYASFNRPEMKVERVSYDVITPSAARGILEAIYWKPQMRWVVDRLHVLRPIRFMQIRRNEIADAVAAGAARKAMRGSSVALGINIAASRQQRAAILLRDVCYGIEAHVEVLDPTDSAGRRCNNPEAKHLDTFRRRAARGQYFHHPYLGCREFPAHFELVEAFIADEDAPGGDVDLGFMLHDITWRRARPGERHGVVVESSAGRRQIAQPRFFRARMRDGVIEVPPLDAPNVVVG